MHYWEKKMNMLLCQWVFFITTYVSIMLHAAIMKWCRKIIWYEKFSSHQCAKSYLPLIVIPVHTHVLVLSCIVLNMPSVQNHCLEMFKKSPIFGCHYISFLYVHISHIVCGEHCPKCSFMLYRFGENVNLSMSFRKVEKRSLLSSTHVSTKVGVLPLSFWCFTKLYSKLHNNVSSCFVFLCELILFTNLILLCMNVTVLLFKFTPNILLW